MSGHTSSSTIIFTELGKKAKDLLKKGFPLKNQAELEVSTKTPNGVKFKATANRERPKASAEGKAASETSTINTGIEQIYEDKEHGIEVNANLQTNPAEGVKAKVTYSPPQFRGLKTVLNYAAFSKKFENKPQDFRHIQADVEYKHPQHFSIAGYVKYSLQGPSPKHRQPAVGGSATFTYDKVTLGGQVEAKLPAEGEKQEITKYGASLDFSSSDFNLTVYSNNEKDEDESNPDKAILGVSYYQKLGDTVEIASDLFCDTNKQEDHPVKITFGGVWKADKWTTMRAKISGDDGGTCALSYQQKINDYTTFTICTEANVSNLGGPHKFGFSLNLSDT